MRVAMIGTRGTSWVEGGVERAVISLAQELKLLGHDVTVYGRSAYRRPGVSGDLELSEITLKHLHGKHTEAASHSLLAALHAALGRKYDLVHFHAVGPAAFSPITRIAGIPTVATIHAFDWQRAKWSRGASLALRAAGEIAGRVPNRTIVVSRTIETYFRQDRNVQVTYIPNGVDLEPSAALSAIPELFGRPFLLFVGRLVPEKGVHVLIEAFRATDTELTLALVGSASHTKEYASELEAAAGSDSRIIFLGPRYGGEKAWLFRNCVAFVQPSVLEGMPIVLLEALAHGARTIVSDIPPHLEVARAVEATGLRVFTVGDSVALARLIAQAVDAERPDESMTRRVMTRFEWKQIAKETEEIYEAAVRDHRTPRSLRCPESRQP